MAVNVHFLTLPNDPISYDHLLSSLPQCSPSWHAVVQRLQLLAPAQCQRHLQRQMEAVCLSADAARALGSRAGSSLPRWVRPSLSREKMMQFYPSPRPHLKLHLRHSSEYRNTTLHTVPISDLQRWRGGISAMGDCDCLHQSRPIPHVPYECRVRHDS
jgi:hypothetical protein